MHAQVSLCPFLLQGNTCTVTLASRTLLLRPFKSQHRHKQGGCTHQALARLNVSMCMAAHRHLSNVSVRMAQQLTAVALSALVAGTRPAMAKTESQTSGLG